MLAAMVAFCAPAVAHDWFTGTRDPVTGGGCCGGSDCSLLKIEPGVLEGEAGGYRLRLTAEQAAKINPSRKQPVDTLIAWDRIQPSHDGNYYLCIPSYPVSTMRGDFYCFWAPPNT